MTRKKKDRSKSYVPMPTIAEEHVDRYRLVMAAATGQLSVSEAARRLGMSRNHFQTLLHRSEAAVIEVVTPQPAGRKARSQKEVELQEQLEQLQRENAKLQSQAETSDRLLGVVSQMLKGKMRPIRMQATRSKKTASKPPATGQDGEEPDPALKRACEMKAHGIPIKLSAAALGVGISTLRRWRCNWRQGLPVRRRRGPCSGARPAPAELEAKVVERVRDLGGLIGSEALRRAFPACPVAAPWP